MPTLEGHCYFVQATNDANTHAGQCTAGSIQGKLVHMLAVRLCRDACLLHSMLTVIP